MFLKRNGATLLANGLCEMREDNDAIENLEAHIQGLERCIGILMNVMIHAIPGAANSLIAQFEAFEEGTRRENCHEREIVLYGRLLRWLRLRDEQTGNNPTNRLDP